MKSVYKLFILIFPSASYRFMVLIPSDVNYIIFEHVIVNIKNKLQHLKFFLSPFTQSRKSFTCYLP